MREVTIIGVGMHPFGKHLNKSMEDLTDAAVWEALSDANLSPKDIQVAYVSNAVAGLITGQEGIRGESVLTPLGIRGIPVINVENACASGTTALRGVWIEIASGLYDVGIALGVEKLFCDDTPKSIRALAALSEPYLWETGFQFTSYYAMKLREYMEKYQVTSEQFAEVVVKNSRNGSLNPRAQHRRPLTVEEVLNSRMIAWPLTLYMCASMGDGAAAAILCAKDVARKYTSKPLITVASSELKSGLFRTGDDTVSQINAVVSKAAYEKANIGPEDIDVAEVHDAMAPVELMLYEELGFCEAGEGGRLLAEGRTKISGDIPVNPSGGLVAKGHPVGATGIAQIAEIVWQLRGECGERQVTNPRTGLVQNQGGWIDGDPAACSVTILKR